MFLSFVFFYMAKFFWKYISHLSAHNMLVVAVVVVVIVVVAFVHWTAGRVKAFGHVIEHPHH